ncbi:MAG: hypothetical protein NZM12_03505, partial [Steroidobacteraceae bacterium]|nr:hypothetical protein [Steroidobacteraceae bacterium]
QFAAAFGIREGGVDALRREVRASMERELADAIRAELRRQVLEALYRDNPLELPRALVEEAIQELQIDAARRLGIREVDKLPARELFEEPARRRVALGLILGELIREQKLQVDRARVNARLAEIVAVYPNPEEVRRQYLQSPQAMRQIESQVQEEQVIDWVLGQARQTPRPTTFRELTKFEPPSRETGK